MAFTKITAAGIGSTETVTLDGVSVINNESIGGNLTVTGNATIGGVLTYEDVTNVDSVGLITARQGIEIGASPGVAASISVDGNMIVSGIATIGTGLTLGDNINAMFGNDGDLRIFHNGNDSTIMNSTGNLTIATDDFRVRGDGYSEYQIKSVKDGAVELYHDNSKKLETASGGVTVTGTVTATSFSGSGADLTGLQAGKFVTDGIGITTATPVGIETTSIARKDLAGPAGNTATGAGSSFHGAYMGDGFLSFNTEFSNPTGYYISTFTNSLVAGPMQLGTTLTIDGTFTIV